MWRPPSTTSSATSAPHCPSRSAPPGPRFSCKGWVPQVPRLWGPGIARGSSNQVGRVARVPGKKGGFPCKGWVPRGASPLGAWDRTASGGPHLGRLCCKWAGVHLIGMRPAHPVAGNCAATRNCAPVIAT
jgi:hypothetical protein